MLSNGEFSAPKPITGATRPALAAMPAGIPIVGTSTSCTLTLKEEAPELLDLHDDAVETLRMGVWDLFEWLREPHDQGELRTDFRPIEWTVPYHAPCQQRAYLRANPHSNCSALSPASTCESHAACCGIAGTYGYKTEKYRIAMDVGAELFDFVHAQGPHIALRPRTSRPAAGRWNTGPASPAATPSSSSPRLMASTTWSGERPSRLPDPTMQTYYEDHD